MTDYKTKYEAVKSENSKLRKRNRQLKRRLRGSKGPYMTMQDVANYAGVSKPTVSRDMDKGLVSYHTLKRIHGQLCFLFTRGEARKYRELKRPVTLRRGESMVEYAMEEGKYEASERFGVKVRSVERALLRAGVKEDYDQKWGYNA